MHKFIANNMKFDYKNHPKFSFISAQLTDTHNPESHAQLKSDLESHGYKPVEVLGHYGNTEKSFFVPHSGSEQDKKNIEKLGNKYNQESVLHSVSGQNHLVHLKDSTKSLFGQGSSNDFSDNYFTEFPNGQKMKLHLGNIESLKKNEDDVLYHYSKIKGLKTIDPTFHGTGMAGEERKRGLIIPRTYYYDTPSDHERRVSAPAQSLYTVKKPEKILDISSDEAKPFIEKARNDYGNIDLNELEGHIKDAGYHGYKNSSSSLANAVAIFHPMPVHSEKMTKSETLGILNSSHIDQIKKDSPKQPNTEYLKVYHGGHPDNLKSLEKDFKILSPEEKLDLPSTGSGKIGLSTSTNPKTSKNYSQVFGHNKVSTFYLHPDAKVLKVNTNGRGIDEHFSNEQIKDLQNKGFDAIHDTDPSENSEFEVRILKPDHVLNERQKFIREQQDKTECPWEQAKEKRQEKLPTGHEMEDIENEEGEDLQKAEKVSKKQQKEDIKKQILDTTHKDADEHSEIPDAKSASNLFRAYKHTPHQPLSLGLKYLVHRIEHLDDYKNAGPYDKKTRNDLDEEFLKFHQKGDAFKKNGHIDARSLRTWMKRNSHLIPQLLNHQEKLHNAIKTIFPDRVKEINGEPHVALTRGLSVPTPTQDHALASYADRQNTGFGAHMFHRWVPMKNLWYSYDFGPKAATSENFGNENEFLVSPHKTIDAEEDDIKELKIPNKHKYTVTPDEKLLGRLRNPKENDFIYHNLGSAIENPNLGNDAWREVLNHPKLDERLMHKALDVADRDMAGKVTHRAIASRKDVPKSVLDRLANDKDSSVHEILAKNPNLDDSHINKLIDSDSGRTVGEVATHPNLKPEHIEKIMNIDTSKMNDSAKNAFDNAKFKAVGHKNTSEKSLILGATNKDPSIAFKAISHPKATPNVLKAGLKHKNVFHDREIATHPNANSEILSLLGKNKSDYVRKISLDHPNATAEHAKALLNDKNPDIVNQAKTFLENKKQTLNKSEGLYHLVQAKDYLCKNECFCALHHAKKALDLGYDCENIFEEARRNLRMEKNMAIELLEKGEITNALKALGFAGALATGAYHYSTPEKTPAFNAPVQQQIVIPQVSKEQIIKDKTLRAISKVESNNNPNAIHRQMSSSGLHQGSRAVGSYGLMPVTIKEMVKKNPDLNKKYGHILNTHGELFRSLIQKNPETEHEIASKLYDNLAKKFGHNPERIGHAWFNGVSGTIKALQENKDLGKHWHVKKIMKEYNSLK